MSIEEKRVAKMKICAGTLVVAELFDFLHPSWWLGNIITKASGSWSYSCFSKGRGRSESTVIFPSTPPSSPSIFKAVEADGHGLKSCQVPRQYVFSISKSHHVSRLIWTLAFVHLPWAPSPGLNIAQLQWLVYHILYTIFSNSNRLPGLPDW